MLDLLPLHANRPKCDGSSRRAFLQIGALAGLGLTLPQLLASQAAAANSAGPRRKKSIILLFLDGGASQIETFDPKMEVPAEYRSLFGTVQTSLPGVEYGSQLPQLAALAHKTSIVRTFTHTDGDHGGATHWVKTGYPWPPQFLGKAPIIPQQSPSIGSVAARYFGATDPKSGVPTYVRVLSNHGGYPGDDAAWLGSAYGPLRCGIGRNSGEMLQNMSLRIDQTRLADRQTLLRGLDNLDRRLHSRLSLRESTPSEARRDPSAAGASPDRPPAAAASPDQPPDSPLHSLDAFRLQALDIVLGRAKEAFDLSQEDPRTREAYGPGLGEELLLARRLCEAGCGFVTLNNGYWDHHDGIIPGLKSLTPPLDRAVAAYIADVERRGLADDILLVVTGEFGRTPRLNGGPGRDHWASDEQHPLATAAA